MARPQTVLTQVCRSCRWRNSRRSNGLCDACNSYLAKYGRLPSEATILKMGRRAMERRLAMGA